MSGNGFIQQITGAVTPNPELNIFILSRAENPNVTNNVNQTTNSETRRQAKSQSKSIQFYDFKLRPKGGNKLVITDILDRNEPNIERVSKKITEIGVEVVFDPNYYSQIDYYPEISNGQSIQAGDQLQALQITNSFMDDVNTLLTNPQGFFIVNVQNPQLNAANITQLVLNDFEWSPRKGSYIIDFKFTFNNVETNKGQTQNISQ